MLGKWPAMVVVGKTVSKERAAEILLRTQTYPISTNEKDFEKAINKIVFGIEKRWPEFEPHSEECRQNLSKLQPIVLEYVHNSQVASCWIGGPHGWCNWDGTIGCSNYNIGKWPSTKVIREEWKKIAKAFPFLELTCQLYGDETHKVEENNLFPVVEYVVKNGKVRQKVPKKKVGKITPLIRFRTTEIGISVGDFKQLYDLVVDKLIKG